MSPPAITLEVSVASQILRVLRDDVPIRTFRVSTAAAGIGSEPGSLRTPIGNFSVSEKIGADQPWGTIFRSRIPAGCWTPDAATRTDLILTRILRLEGLDAENANTAERYIYFHGTNDEASIGSPASHGCIRLTNDDIIEFFNLVPVGSTLVISPHPAPPMKLAFFDCDSTLSAIEGVDELARLRGPEVFAEVEALTNAAMNGEIPIEDIFARRLDIIQPPLSLCSQVAQAYIQHIEPNCLEALNSLRSLGWTPVILSGGFLPVIRPFADFLNISSVEAVPLHFLPDGSYAGFDASYPTTRNGGKPAVINQWKQRLKPQAVIMVGDGVSDLETAPVVDLFIGYGGVVARPHVEEEASLFIRSLAELAGIVETHLATRQTRGTTVPTYSLSKLSCTRSISGESDAAMSSKSNKGKRYSAKEREEILAFVASVNEAKGRGGQSAAASKYQVSPLTIGNWVKQSGAAPKSKAAKTKPAKPKAKGRPPKAKAVKAAKTPAAKTAGSGSFATNLRRLADLHDQIQQAEGQLNKMRAEYGSLKSKL